MIVFLGRRLLLTIPTLFGAMLAVFVLMRAIPGDVVTQLVGAEVEITPERLADMLLRTQVIAHVVNWGRRRSECRARAR